MNLQGPTGGKPVPTAEFGGVQESGGREPHEAGASPAHTPRRVKPQAQALTQDEPCVETSGSPVWPQA